MTDVRVFIHSLIFRTLRIVFIFIFPFSMCVTLVARGLYFQGIFNECITDSYFQRKCGVMQCNEKLLYGTMNVLLMYKCNVQLM